MLKIVDMPEKSRLLFFMDGLQPWAEQELQRQYVQDLASTIVVAESLIERSRESSKRDRNRSPTICGHDEGGGVKPHSQEPLYVTGRPQKSLEQWRGSAAHSDKQRERKWKCYLCDGDHHTRDCPQRKRLSAILSSFETDEDARIGALRILNSVKAKRADKGYTSGAKSAEKPKPNKTLKFVDVSFNGSSFKAFIDSGANQCLVAEKLATQLGLVLSKEPGWIKVVDQPSRPTCGVARSVPIRIGTWEGRMDFTVVQMSDF